MKINYIKLIPIALSLLLISYACKKKEDSTAEFSQRIISVKSYTGNIQDGQSTIEYTGDRISKVTDTYNLFPDSYLFSYPDNNKVNISYTYTEGGITTTESINATLTNNKVSEVINDYSDGKYKTTYTYNSDGNVESISEYNYISTWILMGNIEHSYKSGKLSEVLSTEYGSSSGWVDKFVYSYNGEELKEKIYSYKSGTDWIESSKSAYIYVAGRITKIKYYYKNGTIWTETGNTEFSYDADGNLTKEINSSNGINYTTEYSYEEGSGNFRQIADILTFSNYDSMYPIANKKSQENDINNIHKFNPGKWNKGF